ncbi:hypothetical protein AB4Y32_35265 [Paraburkholderia phymatum]|uniref:Uncharacterized protein n=1 Tax=Paraburkholderia phymatum TaxID=148447 RepID=A0ACC6UBT9_9BURK
MKSVVRAVNENSWRCCFSANLGSLIAALSTSRFFGQNNAIAEPHRFNDTQRNAAIEQPRSMRRFLANENRAGSDNRTSRTSGTASSPLFTAK